MGFGHPAGVVVAGGLGSMGYWNVPVYHGSFKHGKLKKQIEREEQELMELITIIAASGIMEE